MTATARLRALLKAAGVFLLCALIAVHFALNLQQNGRTHLDAGAYASLQEKRPYQYRVLMAPVLGGLIALYAQPAAQAVTHRLPSYVAAAEPAAYFTINALSFALSLLLVRAIARRSFASRGGAATAVALYVAMAYAFFCLNPNVGFILPYDAPGLALSQACILCILAGRFGLLLPLFALATVNRETSFLVVLFLAARSLFPLAGAPAPASRPAAWRVVVALAALWLAIKVALYWRFADLPSDEGLRIQLNLLTLAKPWQWPAILPLLAAFALCLRSLVRQPAGRAWSSVGCLGFLLLGAVGQIVETRVFGDLMVYFALAIAHGWGADRRLAGSRGAVASNGR